MDQAPTRIPIACSLTAQDLTDRGAAWRKLLEISLVAADRIPGGIRLSVHPGSAGSLRDLVALERECCPWIRSRLDGSGVTFTAQGAGEAALVEMFSAVPGVRPRESPQ